MKSPRAVSRSGGGYRERGFGSGGGSADRYGPDYGARRAWNDDPSFQRRELSPESRERLRYERERERLLYERDRYERQQHHPDAPYGRSWHGASSIRDPYDYRSEPSRDPSDMIPAASRYPLDPRNPRERERDREADRYSTRLPPTASRYDQRESIHGRERERESYSARVHDGHFYERPDRDAHYHDDRRQSPPALRYGSPRSSSHRSSPTASQRPSPPAGQQMHFAPPLSADARMSHRGSAAEQSQVAHIEAPSQASPATPLTAVPTGPRRSFVQAASYADALGEAHQPRSAPVPVLSRPPPTGPRASFGGGSNADNGGVHARAYDRSPSRAYDRSSYSAAEGPQRLQQQQGVGSAPMGLGSRRDGFGRESASHLQLPAQLSTPDGGAQAASSDPTTLVVPITPASGSRRGTWTDADNKAKEEVETKPTADYLRMFDITLDRIRSAQTNHTHPTMVALRKALNELADSDVELAGARFKTSVAEATLEKAKEEAEAWSIETARIELEQRNGGVKSFWQPASSSSAPTVAP